MTADWTLSHEGFALLRNPLLPERTLDAFATADLGANLAALQAAVTRPLVRGAIANASTGLGARAAELDPAARSPKSLKLAYSVYKYLARMSTRCTPFGVMATVTTVPIAARQQLALTRPVEVHARLDNHQTGRLAAHFRERLLSGGLAGFRVRACNTLTPIGSQLHHVVRAQKSGAYSYSLAEVAATPEIDAVVALARDWIDVVELQTACCAALDCTADEAHGFLRALLKRQILRPEMELDVTSGNCFDALLARARAIPALADEAEAFASLAARLSDRVDFDAFLASDIEQSVRATFEALLPGQDERHWIHADAYRPEPDAALDNETLCPVLEDLTRLAPLLWAPDRQLADFTQAFVRRYGDAEVPLLEALDADSGVPIGALRRVASPLLLGVIAAEQSREGQVRWGPWDQFLLEKTLEARERGDEEIVLSVEEIEKYRTFGSPVPQAFDDTWSLHMSMLALDGGDGRPRILYQGMHGVSALSVLGRFTEGDPALRAQCLSLAEREQARTNAVLAEIVHAPQGRLANICTRSRLRAAEIAYGPGVTGAELQQAIHCADLRVRVDGGRLRLRDIRSGREVHPRLASAHNTGGHNLPVYQFLAMMQHGSGHFYGLRRASLFATMRFQPRIRHGSVVLQLASWTLNSGEIRRLTEPQDVDTRLAGLAQFRAERRLPRYIALPEGDNVLEIDLDSPLSCLTFLAEIADKRMGVVNESVRRVSEPVVTLDGAPLRNEFFVPLRVTAAKSGLLRDDPEPAGAAPSVERWRVRNELPLERWIFLEIHMGQGSADGFIAGPLRALVATLRDGGLLRDWFFIRYQSEVGFHLRLRLRPSDEQSRHTLTAQALEQLRLLQSNGLIWRVRIEGYEPETERYGGELALLHCEALFCERSERIADTLAAIVESPAREELRWQIGAVLLWDQLNVALPDAVAIETFCTRVYDGYRREMPSNDTTAKAVSDNFRNHRAVLEAALLSPPPDSVFAMARADATRDWRVAQWQAVREAASPDALHRVLASLLHMDCNRLFPFDARANEMMLFEYLARAARSQHARSRPRASA
jgi:thiopeptide-type bacteriocin biosynthesis protein